MNLNINIYIPVSVEKPGEVTIIAIECNLNQYDVQLTYPIDNCINHIKKFKKLERSIYFIISVIKKSLKIDSSLKSYFSPISYNICKFLKKTSSIESQAEILYYYLLKRYRGAG